MMILAFLTLMLITNGSAEGEIVGHVTGYVGQDVLLPCGCSNDSKVAWQKGLRVVNAYLQDSSTNIDQAYVDRTELFLEKEKSNCSIMIRNISSVDAGVYTCYPIVEVQGRVWSKKSLEFNLTVSENEVSSPQPFEAKSTDAVTIGVPILVVLIVVLGVAVLLTSFLRNKRRHRTNTDLPALQPMIQSV
ncbi:sodium channel subunit beta-2 [Pseudorasbora parva]|uniref:sodium channel subunit beta-2 n=1 Tax=Pseudorasbora parva TaxID=51549 RepID=UPI00351DF2C2